MAGLMHDLGHGPFSHAFDRGVIPTLLRLKGRTAADIDNWTHERASVLLLDHMIETHSLPVEDDEFDPQFIKDLILCEDHKEKYQEKKWMFEIVANKRNSFDVDKLDYLCRDNYHCGLNQQQGHQDYINYSQILQSSRVINNQIAYNVKVINSIKMVFDLRFEMFRAIYNHKRAQALDLMYRDVLVNADPKFRFLENLNDPEHYRNWTDLIVKRIERSDDIRLKKSKEIITRIQSRDLFQYVDGFFLERWEWKKAFNE